MAKKKLPVIAVDEGSSRVKLTYLNEKGELVTQITTSISQQGKIPTKDMNYDKAGFILDNGNILTVKDNVMAETSNVVASLYQFGDANLAAVQNALIEAGFGGQEVEIVVSLPVGFFFNPVDSVEVVNRENIELKKKNLMRKVTPVRDDLVKCAIIKNVKVCSEALTAFETIGELNVDGSTVRVDPHEKFIIFDIGESTLDVTVIMGSGDITQTRFSSDLAVSKVIKQLCRQLGKEEDEDISHAWGAEILRAGKFKDRSIRAQINKAADLVFEEIKYKILEEVPKLRGMTRAYVIGGGAHVFGKRFNELHPRVVIPQQPELVLARSMLIAVGAEPIVMAEKVEA